MKTLVASGFALLILCGPALADSAPPKQPTSFQLHFALRDAATTRMFDVIVSPGHACATVTEKLSNRQIAISACPAGDNHLSVEWSLFGPSGEYRSQSTFPLAHGATAELGTTSGPRLGVTVQ